MRFAEVKASVYGRTKEGTWVALKVRPGGPISNFVYPVMAEEEFCDGEKTSFLALTDNGELRMVCGKLWQICNLQHNWDGCGYHDTFEAVQTVSEYRSAGRLFAAVPAALEFGVLDERRDIPPDAYQVEADSDIVWAKDNRSNERINIWCKVKERVIVPRQNKAADSDDNRALRLPDDVAMAVRQWAKARNQTPQEIVEGIIRTSMKMANSNAS